VNPSDTRTRSLVKSSAMPPENSQPRQIFRNEGGRTHSLDKFPAMAAEALAASSNFQQ
jgi:hypothetical protein